MIVSVKLKLIYHTIKYLKISQLGFRVLRKFLPIKPKRIRCTKSQTFPVDFVRPVRRSQKISAQSLLFLNESVNFSKDIWSETQHSMLWIYNLHYFEDLNNIDASLRIQQHRDLVNDWVRNYHFRSNRLGWHAFPISKRIVNWIKWDIRLSVLDTDALDSGFPGRIFEPSVGKRSAR